MNVLVACESSGIVAAAFRARGHNAYSCDLLPCDRPEWAQWHVQVDVRKVFAAWLKNLATLVPTKILPLPECGHWENQTPSGQNKLGPSADRWKERSKTYQGIADAMASQWG